MKLPRTIFALIIFVAFATPALADIIPLSAISGYFNNMTTAEADFTQVNDDGSSSTGRIMIRRPGRIRFEYNPPEASLVIAGGRKVAIFDAKSNQPPEQFPLARTPLNLILARTVDFSRAEMVVGHSEKGTATSVVVQDPKNPEYGTIELVFTGDPVALRQWVVTDGSGQRTTVVLGEFTYGRRLPAGLFSIRSELDTRGF